MKNGTDYYSMIGRDPDEMISAKLDLIDERFETKVQKSYLPTVYSNAFCPKIAYNLFIRKYFGEWKLYERIPLNEAGEPDLCSPNVHIIMIKFFKSMSNLIESLQNSNDKILQLKYLIEFYESISILDSMFLDLLKGEGCFEGHRFYYVQGELFEKFGKIIYLRLTEAELLNGKYNTTFTLVFDEPCTSLYKKLTNDWAEVLMLGPDHNLNSWFKGIYKVSSFRTEASSIELNDFDYATKLLGTEDRKYYEQNTFIHGDLSGFKLTTGQVEYMELKSIEDPLHCISSSKVLELAKDIKKTIDPSCNPKPDCTRWFTDSAKRLSKEHSRKIVCRDCKTGLYWVRIEDANLFTVGRPGRKPR